MYIYYFITNYQGAVMKKHLIILALGTGLLFADSTSSLDLLKEATNNEIIGSQYELNNTEMKNIEGGYTYPSYVSKIFYNSLYNSLNNKLLPSSDKSSSKSRKTVSISDSMYTRIGTTSTYKVISYSDYINRY